MKSNYILFCDESGNSGSKFYDVSQPFYLEAGWIINENDVDSARSLITRLEQKSNYTVKTKGSNIKKSKKGLLYCIELFHNLGKIGALPFLYIVEKRFAVCAKIVETYLDSEYNDNVDVMELSDPEHRQKCANIFYEGPEELIEEFASAYREGNSDVIEINAKKWVEYFKTINPSFSKKIEGCLSNINTNSKEEYESIHKDLNIGFDSLNMPCIVSILQHAEIHIPFNVKIVHDKIATFEDVYMHVYKMYKDAVPLHMVLKDGRKIAFGFKNLKALEFSDSEEEPILRASDCLAATASDYANCVMNNKPYEKELIECAYASFGGILAEAMAYILRQHCPKLGEIFGSDKFISKVLNQLRIDKKS